MAGMVAATARASGDIDPEGGRGAGRSDASGVCGPDGERDGGELSARCGGDGGHDETPATGGGVAGGVVGAGAGGDGQPTGVISRRRAVIWTGCGTPGMVDCPPGPAYEIGGITGAERLFAEGPLNGGGPDSVVAGSRGRGADVAGGGAGCAGPGKDSVDVTDGSAGAAGCPITGVR
jgi:hypothetical protein